MSVRITDLPEATELNGSELMPIVQNGVTRRTTLDFVNQAAPAALILQQTQQVLADTQQVLADTQQVKADTDQVLVNTEGVYNQTVMVQGQVEISIADWETQYLGAKSDPPTTDNEGNPLHIGTLYWDTSLNAMFVWSGTSWTAFSSAVASVNGQIGEVVLDYADVGAANSGANDNITSMSGVTGDIGSAAGLQFNTLTPSATAVGKLTWNVEDSTLDLGMAGGVVQQIGQGMFYSVQNQTGFPINEGSVVRAVGTLNTSGRILVAPATADGVYPSHTFMGVATETIQDGDPGLITFFGKVRDINTTGAIYGETWVDGDILYAHPGAAGGLTKVKPQAPNNIVMVALVIKAAVSGTLFVRTTYSSNLRDDELVRLNGLADGDVLQYDADLGRFENRTLSGAGIEPLGAAADSMVAHLAALDPHPQYTTPAEAAAAAPVQSVAGRTGAVSLTKADVGLANVDNTSDLNKPISTATQNALNLRVSKDSNTGAAELPAGTTAQRPAGAMGKLRFNSTLDQFEGHNGSDWRPVGGGALGQRNKIINGKMEIAQRGTSFPAVANAAYSLDRWRYGGIGSQSITISQQTDVPSSNEFQNSLRTAVTTASTSIASGDYDHLIQRIEGFNVRDLIGRTFTFSFWVRSSKTGTHCVAFRNSAPDRSYVTEYTISAANTWEYKTITVSGGLITAGTWNWTNGIGLQVAFTLAAGSAYQTTADAWQTGDFLATANQVNCLDTIGNIFAITGVQLEVGSVATPFEHRPYGAELELCGRYCQLADGGFTGAITSGAVYSGFIRLHPMMRVVPTTTVAGNVALNGFPGSPTLQIVSAGGVRTSQTANATITDGYAIHRIRAEAEL